MPNPVEITLTNDSRPGLEPKRFVAQTVEISHEPDIELLGVDGKISAGAQPSVVRWLGGKKDDLKHIADVKVVDSLGVVLIDGRLNEHSTVIREVDGWLTFAVLKG